MVDTWIFPGWSGHARPWSRRIPTSVNKPSCNTGCARQMCIHHILARCTTDRNRSPALAEPGHGETVPGPHRPLDQTSRSPSAVIIPEHSKFSKIESTTIHIASNRCYSLSDQGFNGRAK